MKRFAFILTALLLMVPSLHAASVTDLGNADVCVLLVVGTGGYSSSVQRSCDGEDRQNLNKKKNLFIEELSYQLSSLYAHGMHLINCQVNNLGTQAEYICVVAR